MKSIEINVTARKNLGKKEARAMRLNKNVPCVLYGGKENIYFSAHENTFKDIIYSKDVYVIKLNVDGTVYQAIMKETQFHPVTDSLLHIDFMEISGDKPSVVHIPVTITGSAVGVIEGGKLRQRKRYIRVKGLITDLPESLTLDVSEIKIGQSILAGDLSYDKFEILEPKRAAVVGVISSRAAARSMGEEPVVAAAAVAVPAEGVAAPAEGVAAPAPEKTEKTEKSEKSEKPGKYEKPEKQDKSKK
jgi:large subunit ribosomal protein L25